jgi:hypothetical protein
MDRPRPIEFMVRGYSVPEMLRILERWDQMTEAEKAELGFTPDPLSPPKRPSVRLVQ